MVNKTLAALVSLASDLDLGKNSPLSYFAEKRLAEQGVDLLRMGFIRIDGHNREAKYSVTNLGKNILNEIDEYYDIISIEHLGLK